MTTAVADTEPQDLRTIKRTPWLLGVTSQKEQLGIISMLVVHITVLLYFLIFIVILVLVFRLLRLRHYSLRRKEIAFN